MYESKQHQFVEREEDALEVRYSCTVRHSQQQPISQHCTVPTWADHFCGPADNCCFTTGETLSFQRTQWSIGILQTRDI
eukprot:COSAG02_NODE_41486_length_394_cov_0.718644_1_plen_78_part_10